MLRSLFFLIGLSVAAIASAEPPPRPAQLGLCSACHGEGGHSTGPGIPHLAGQDETYLALALRQYRSGARAASAMRAVSGALQDREIAALAAWYAAQKVAP
ncbi:MAG: c-type cytochrome [Dokdonella sp.]